MNFNYAEIFNYVYEKLRKAYGWTIEILSESVYANLISAFSYGVEQLAFYDEILTKESVYKSAELYSSVNYISWMLNYTPHRKQGATSLVYISADPSFNLRTGQYTYSGESSYVNKWTPIVGDNINAYAIEDILIPNGVKVAHYNLPVNFDTAQPNLNTPALYNGKITIVTDDGIALVPVTVTDVNLYQNSTLVSNDSLNISLGTTVNIYKSSMFSGEYNVVKIPSAYNNFSSNNYIAIQTNYYARTGEFETIQLGTILSVGQIRLNVREGIPNEYTYTSVGSLNEKIPIYSPNIDNEEIEVFLISTSTRTINGVNTTIVTVTDEVTVLKEDAYLVNDLSKYYCTIYNDPNFRYIYVEFGDDIKTKKLSNGQKVLIKYAETQGSLTNTTSLNVIDSFGVNLVSDRGTVVTGLYVTNVIGFTNGTDYESIDSIKYNSRARFNESNLLISNWTPVINSYPSVLKSKVWTETDIDPFTINSTTQNTVYIGAINKSGNPIFSGSIEASNLLYLYLRNFSSPTDVIVFKDTNVINLKAIIYYKINPTNIPLFQQVVIQNIKDQYDIFNVDFGLSVYDSNIISIVENYSTDVIYCRVKLYYSESSYYNKYIKNDNDRMYLTATYRNNNIQKDSYIIDSGISKTRLSVWIRRRIASSWQSWIKIGEQVDGQSLILKFNTNTLYSDYENNRKIKIEPTTQINTSFPAVQVGDILVQDGTSNGLLLYRGAIADDELNDDDDNITAYYYLQGYNLNGDFKFTLVEVGEITTTNLIPTNNQLPTFNLTDVDGDEIVNGTTRYYYLTSNTANRGKLTTVKGTQKRKFMIKAEANKVVIVKGFYFSDTTIESQGLYNSLATEPKYYNYISNLNIECIDKELVPNSNQVVYNSSTNTYIKDISYTYPFTTNVDIINPEDTDARGYELKIVYNTVENGASFVHDNDIRLPYFTNILDIQSEDIEFIKES